MTKALNDYETVRTDGEIDAVLNIAAEQEEKGGTAFPGMTFEQGVDRAIRWMAGHNDDAPLGEE